MDSANPLHRLFYLFFAFCAIALSLGCSSNDGFVTYSKDGFSIEHPSSWRFQRDQAFSLNGSREIVFEFGEFSYATFYYNDRVGHKQFADAYIERSFLKDSGDTAKVVNKTAYDVVGRAALEYRLTAEFLGAMNTRVISVDVSLDDEPIFLVVAIAEEDELEVQPILERVVSSVKEIK